jgi:gamma-glutamyltranspeptidase/glutathione hydrolase
MSPTIVLRSGKPLLLLGSAGTERIISSTLETIVNVVDGGMTLGAAVARPRALWGGNQDRRVWLELAGEITEARADALVGRGFTNMYRHVFPGDPANLGGFGCVNAVLIDHERGLFVGVGDPRREGAAAGVPPEAVH